MPRARHRFQCGPSTFAAEQRPGSLRWWVHEVWWEVTGRGEQEDFEEWHGPFDSKTWAEAKAAEWSER